MASAEFAFLGLALPVDDTELLTEARRVWREAWRGHLLVPPDAGFSARLSALAAAATWPGRCTAAFNAMLAG
jgi:hypothetical protein